MTVLSKFQGRTKLCALFLCCTLSATFPVQAETDFIKVLEGQWGFELLPDMSCAQNPAKIRLSEADSQLIFTWPNAVTNADGSVTDKQTFTILSVKGRKIKLSRDSDGQTATIKVSADGRSFQYYEANPKTGSAFARCVSRSG